MPETIMLSESAAALLCRRLSGEWVEVDDLTKPSYRELAAAGLMYLISGVSGFTRGRGANFRFTGRGWALRPTATADPQAGSP